jgi:hypothetical protein
MKRTKETKKMKQNNLSLSINAALGAVVISSGGFCSQ